MPCIWTVFIFQRASISFYIWTWFLSKRTWISTCVSACIFLLYTFVNLSVRLSLSTFLSDMGSFEKFFSSWENGQPFLSQRMKRKGNLEVLPNITKTNWKLFLFVFSFGLLQKIKERPFDHSCRKCNIFYGIKCISVGFLWGRATVFIIVNSFIKFETDQFLPRKKKLKHLFHFFLLRYNCNQ
jgi:hypothetical protein